MTVNEQIQKLRWHVSRCEYHRDQIIKKWATNPEQGEAHLVRLMAHKEIILALMKDQE